MCTEPHLWNEDYPPGTAVWAVGDDGQAFLTLTSSLAVYDPESRMGVVGVYGCPTPRRLDQVVRADLSHGPTAHLNAIKHAAGEGFVWNPTTADAELSGRDEKRGIFLNTDLRRGMCVLTTVRRIESHAAATVEQLLALPAVR